MFEKSRLGQHIFSGAAFADLAILPKDFRVLAAATTKGLFVSVDGGEDWVHQDFGPGSEEATSIAINPRRPTSAFVAIWGRGIFRTEALRENAEWHQVQNGLPLSNVGRIKIVWAPSDPNRVFALFSTADHDLRVLYISEDEGRSWSLVPGVPDLLHGEGFYHMLLGVHPASAGLISV
jgi:hypothetical protein